MSTSGDLYLNVTTVLVVVVTLLAYALYRSTKRPAGLPPGPFPWPVIGNIHLFVFKKSIFEVFTELRQKYGDVFSLKMGSRHTIVLNSVDVVKEALLKNGAVFAGRPNIHSMEIFTEGNKDIVFSTYNAQWRFQRRLGHQAIRHFTQKDKLENLVNSVTPKLAEVLDKVGDKPFAPKYTIGLVVYNVLATLCFGKQYDLDAPDLVNWIKMNVELQEILGNGLAADYFPVLRNIPVLGGSRKMKAVIIEAFNMFYHELDRHRKSLDPENVRDFIDSLLITQKEAMETGEEEAKQITDTHVVQTVVDIFTAGTETTVLSLHWLVGIMAEYPDIQERIAKEIDDVIGCDTLPSLDYRGLLPYTEAVILEGLRFGSVVPFGVPHSTTTDTTLAGYDIPKDTMVMINHIGLHFDPKVWDEPEKFKPERFLNENGQLLSKMPESLLPFSAGRRVCLGEDFARKEVFLLCTWLFSRYKFYKVPGKESESVLTLNAVSGILHQPLDEMEVCVKKR